MTDARSPATVRQDFRSAAWLGLVTSTFSPIVVSLAAGRIGRDADVEWTIVASLLLRDAAWQPEPRWPAIAVGILIHQAADFWWVIVFFGFLGRWTSGLRPGTLLLLAPAWAVATSLLEWLVIVPLLPFWQPAFTLTQAWWIGLVVHLLSASLYPLFPSVRGRLAGQLPTPHRRFATAWSIAAAMGLAVFAVLAVMGANDRELPHSGADAARDRSYMRRMAVHHEQGVQLAMLARSQAADPHLRALARLMIAGQRAEIDILARWWRSWFDDPPALVCSQAERAAMPGMLPPERIAELARLRGAEFDAEFVRLMSEHHRGAVRMADDALRTAGDVRLRWMSHAIRHEQRGEIALMHGVEGPPAVALAVRAMVDGAGAHPADRPGAFEGRKTVGGGPPTGSPTSP